MFKDGERQRVLRPYVLKQFISGVMTDDERAQLWGLPKSCRMRENAKIISPENLVCGENVWIGEGAVLDASGGLEIGSHTSIGLGVYIWSHTSWLQNVCDDVRSGSGLIYRKKTKIGNGCFIGGPAVVYHGVTMADRTVILPMSTVTKDTPGNCIMAGSPAKVIREIDEAFIEAEIKRLGLKRPDPAAT